MTLFYRILHIKSRGVREWVLESGGKGWVWGQRSIAREKADMPETNGQLLMLTQAKRQCDG